MRALGVILAVCATVAMATAEAQIRLIPQSKVDSARNVATADVGMRFVAGTTVDFGEIAEDVGISRQGVRDSLKKAERELYFYESKLHLVERESAVREAGAKLQALAASTPELVAAAEALIAAAGGENLTF